MILANKISGSTPLATLSSFLRSTEIQQYHCLTIDQIDVLLANISEAYAQPLLPGQRSQAVVRKMLIIKRDQLIERGFRPTPHRKNDEKTLKEEAVFSSNSWQATFLHWLGFIRASNQSVSKSPVRDKFQGYNHSSTNCLASGKDFQQQLLLSQVDMESSLEKKKAE